MFEYSINAHTNHTGGLFTQHSFCITFGSLFAKMRRVHILFEAANSMVRVTATGKETLMVVGGALLVDVIILSVWTAVDPLQWYRHSLSEDKFGVPLASEGYCVSDSWAVFVSIIAVYHFALLSMASWICYLSRDIPTKFSEGKYVSIAIVSNMQVRQERCALYDCFHPLTDFLTFPVFIKFARSL